jgi:hypothetical protein
MCCPGSFAKAEREERGEERGRGSWEMVRGRQRYVFVERRFRMRKRWGGGFGAAASGAMVEEREAMMGNCYQPNGEGEIEEGV